MTSVRRRSPWLMYVVVLATSGLFAFLWAVLMLRDAGLVAPRGRNWIGLSALLLGGLTLHFVLFGLLLDSSPMTSMHKLLAISDGFIALGVLGLLAVVVVKTNNWINLAQGLRSTVWSTVSLVGLTLFMSLSLPILQQRINNTADAEPSWQA